MFTIVYGCSRAVKESHLKRRLAWSTVSNLSYIIFGAVIMTPFGLAGALSHFVFHGVMKMCCFLCAGAFIHQTGKEYVYDIDGCGKKLKTVFSDEPPIKQADKNERYIPASCSFTPSVAGLIIASEVIKDLIS